MKENNYNLDFIKIKYICSMKDTVERINGQARDGEKIPA